MRIYRTYSFIELWRSQLLIRLIINFTGTHKTHSTHRCGNHLEVYKNYNLNEDSIFLKVKRK